MTDVQSLIGQWPPALDEAQVEALSTLATSWALSHGLLYLPVLSPQPPVPAAAIHAPISLFPSPFPRKLFLQAQRIQRTYNNLYSRIAMDTQFLDSVMGSEEGVGKVDEFTGQLWRGWKALRDDNAQPLQLGLFRSDYLLHSSEGKGLSLKQVEFNTISSSFGCLSQRAAAMHRYLQHSSQYFGVSEHLKPDNFPSNETTAGLAEGLAAAHKAYGKPKSFILFVVQGGERNVFDQRWLEYELLERHDIHVVRQSLDELAASASVDDKKVLHIALTSSSSIEISTVYFRAGYTPTDYPTAAHYQTRFLVERSAAIKCPSIPLQLAGGKKVQEVLTQPGVLDRFLDDTTRASASEMRASWMGMWGLDVAPDGLTADTAPGEPHGVRRARELAARLVLKPQREGGGNNVYKEAIPAFLDTLPPTERAAWIAMELIEPPAGAGNYLVRSGGGAAVRTEVVSELGIFGWSLFGGGKVEEEREVGWLLRTKGKDSNEGGVAAGFSVLDSVLLVGEAA
ncbi:glutathione synthase [Schizophyllum amplum]|uniref:Glutathione synthetase n=1 Tax=Schizophyllum amplum TaxID=97359 RepID=A0A550CBB6_9AGAR|nr:glutathione synthase [Auriculariopsis ampla]